MTELTPKDARELFYRTMRSISNHAEYAISAEEHDRTEALHAALDDIARLVAQAREHAERAGLKRGQS